MENWLTAESMRWIFCSPVTLPLPAPADLPLLTGPATAPFKPLVSIQASIFK